MRHRKVWGRITNELRGWKNEGALVFHKPGGWLVSIDDGWPLWQLDFVGFLVRGRRTNPKTKRGYVIVEVPS